MKKISIGLGVMACGFSCLVGCAGGAQYTIVSRTAPQAFARPACHVVVEPIHADHLMVSEQTEAQFLAAKRPNQVWAFNRDKRVSEEKFMSELRDGRSKVFAPGSADSTFVIRPTWSAWDPGKFMGMFSKPGVGTFSFDVLSPSGERLDRIEIQPSVVSYAAADRMHGVFKEAGASLGKYIDENWACAAR
ncbi:MAG TPA: hypothetical protein VGH28_18215 [Polyangiaceae bacterium]|jgi:hypothetical protein